MEENVVDEEDSPQNNFMARRINRKLNLEFEFLVDPPSATKKLKKPKVLSVLSCGSFSSVMLGCSVVIIWL